MVRERVGDDNEAQVGSRGGYCCVEQLQTNVLLNIFIYCCKSWTK